MTRRKFIGVTGGATLGLLAASTFDRAGRFAQPAWAGATCDAGTITLWSNGTTGPCSPNGSGTADDGYAVNDNCAGCDGPEKSDYWCHQSFSGSPDHPSFYVQYNAYHRDCSEDTSAKTFKFRTNACYAGSYDGWQWWTDQCGCDSGEQKKFACNDGYAYTKGSSDPPLETICMTAACV